VSLVTDMRQVVHLGNQIGQDLGANCYVTKFRREQYDRPLEDSAVLNVGASPYTVLTPAPPVVKLDAERAALFGGGLLVASTGAPVADVWTIGPIPLPFTDVNGNPQGWSVATLNPAVTAPSQRVVYVLIGPDTETDGAVCEVVEVRSSDDLQTYLTVKRTARIGAP
jgi:hypothetical protein